MGASTKHTKGGLTIQEEKMCQLYVNGGKGVAGNHTECYAQVYNTTLTRPSLWTKAYQKFKEPRVQDRIAELVAVWDENWVKAKLKQFADEAEHDRDAIKATELLGKTKAMFIEKQEVALDVDGFEMPSEEK